MNTTRRNFISLSALALTGTASRIAAAASTKAALTGMLGFDDPLNDLIARKHGQDYGSQFMAGLSETFKAPNYGNNVVAMEPESNLAASQSSINVNITVNGSVFVDDLMTLIEDTVNQTMGRLELDEYTQSGTLELMEG